MRLSVPFETEGSVTGSSISESGLGEGAFMSGEGIGLVKAGFISSSFFFRCFTLDENVLYAWNHNGFETNTLIFRAEYVYVRHQLHVFLVVTQLRLRLVQQRYQMAPGLNLQLQSAQIQFYAFHVVLHFFLHVVHMRPICKYSTKNCNEYYNIKAKLNTL